MLMACGPQPLSIEAQTQDASCRPNQLCEYDNQVKIWLSEQQITPETPFEIHLSLPSTLLVHSAKLEGITMYMGYIPVLFEPRNDILVAQGMVGICSERNMTWKLTLEVKNPQGQLKQIFYYFDATY